MKILKSDWPLLMFYVGAPIALIVFGRGLLVVVGIGILAVEAILLWFFGDKLPPLSERRIRFW